MMPVIKRNNRNWLPSIFNDLFDEDFMISPHRIFNSPAINVIESKNNYKIEVAAPGMTKEDFNVNIDEENNIVISMEKKSETPELKEGAKCGDEHPHYLRREFAYSRFRQVMSLPEDVEKEKISAKVEHGILNITLPKKRVEEQKSAHQKINIQ